MRSTDASSLKWQVEKRKFEFDPSSAVILHCRDANFFVKYKLDIEEFDNSTIICFQATLKIGIFFSFFLTTPLQRLLQTVDQGIIFNVEEANGTH